MTKAEIGKCEGGDRYMAFDVCIGAKLSELCPGPTSVEVPGFGTLSEPVALIRAVDDSRVYGGGARRLR